MSGGKAEKRSSSFLKQRTKKLLLCWLTRWLRLARTEAGKSFLVLFFKKELLLSRLLYPGPRTVKYSGRL